MSSSSLSLDGGKGWEEGASAAKGDDDGNALSTALEKERIIRDIGETQNGLVALLGRVDEVTEDIKRLSEENAMLQVYLDNMTKNSAMFAGAKGDKR